MKPDASSLCTRCGMCCDGTLFDNAKAKPEELPRLAAAGIATGEAKGRPVFAQPCPMLEGGCCTIYEERFSSCRSFRCKLLVRFLDQEVGLEEAIRRVEAARVLVARVAAADPAAATVSHRRALARSAADWAGESDPERRAARARVHLDIVALESFLNRHFRKGADSETLLG